jgi:geranylgeranyl pyrophosphate synthase
MQDIKRELSESALLFESELMTRLSSLPLVSDRLGEAMRYSLEAGGKRLRPALVLWCCELCGGSREVAMPAALAVECVHTFSLIHDDLPAIDNDDLRRGRPTLHKQFDEATAILAGDALLALAFEILTESPVGAGAIKLMTRELAHATGAAGMIGGEAVDIEAQSRPPDAALVAAIHAAKTARLIEASCRLGGIAAGASGDQMSALGKYGHALGLAFQVADDLLDITGTAEALGKRTQKDAASGKQTYPRAVGIEASRALAAGSIDEAIEALSPFGSGARRLGGLARFVIERES